MKKLITLVACLAVVSVGFAKGKGSDLKKFSFGAKTGLNVAYFAGTNTKNLHESIKVNMGFHIGVASEIKGSDDFAFAPELLFSTQGFRTDIDAIGDMGSINVNYIAIPILARFYIINCLSLDVGPYVGFATGVNIKDDGETVKVSSDEYNIFDYGLCLGMTYNLNHKFFASARYEIGITDVVKTLNNTNSVFQFSVGYNFFSRD